LVEKELQKMLVRMFRNNISWLDDIIYLFPENITWKEITNNMETSLIEKKDYIGIINMDRAFLNNVNNDFINGKIYYYFNNGCRT